MGTRISSKKMVSNTQRRITDGTINAEMPRMLAHVLSRQKSCRGRRIGGHVRGGRGFIPSNISPLNRVQTGLDTFDGLTPRLLDTGARSQVEGNLVQGVVLAVLDGCSALSSLSAVGGLPDCNVIGVSAELLN